MTPEQRSLRAKLAAQTRWAKTRDRTAATAKSREAWAARWEQKADPNSELSPAERAAAGERLMKAHMTAMALRSSIARGRRNSRNRGAA